MTTKNYVFSLVVGILLFLSCNKGNFDPTVCGDCPKLTTCIRGYCDCDTSVSFKFGNECIEKDTGFFICLNPDTSIWPEPVILEYWGYDDFENEHSYALSPAKGFQPKRGGADEYYYGKYYFMGDYDTISIQDKFRTYLINGNTYYRLLAGRKYAMDSLELRVYNLNQSTNMFEDTSIVMTFRTP